MQRSLESQPNTKNPFSETGNNIYLLTLEIQRTKSRIANAIREEIGNAVRETEKGVLPDYIDVADGAPYLEYATRNKTAVEYDTRTNQLHLVRVTTTENGNRLTGMLKTLGDDAWMQHGKALAHILEIAVNMHQYSKRQ